MRDLAQEADEIFKQQDAKIEGIHKEMKEGFNDIKQQLSLLFDVHTNREDGKLPSQVVPNPKATTNSKATMCGIRTRSGKTTQDPKPTQDADQNKEKEIIDVEEEETEREVTVMKSPPKSPRKKVTVPKPKVKLGNLPFPQRANRQKEEREFKKFMLWL